MGPAIYVIAILGCGEGDTACQPVAFAPVQYRSEADCNANTADAIATHSDVAFPVVVAQCQKAGTPAAQTVFADDVNLPDAANPSIDRPRVRQANYRLLASRD